MYCSDSILIASPYRPDSAFALLSKSQFHKFFISFTMYISQYTILTNLTFLQPFSAKLLSFSMRYSHFFITFPEGRIKKTQIICHPLLDIKIVFLFPKFNVVTHQGPRKTVHVVVGYQTAELQISQAVDTWHTKKLCSWANGDQWEMKYK